MGRFCRSPSFDSAIVHELDRLDGRFVNNAVVGRHLVICAVQAAFRAGSVVAVNVDNQRVFELAHVLDRLNHAANLIVGVGGIAGIDLRLAGIHLLFHLAERLPLW